MTHPYRGGGGFLFRIAFVIGIVLSVLVVLSPLDVENQTIFAAASCSALFLLRMKTSRLATLALVYLSVCVSCRYILWRATDTLVFTSALEAVLGYALFAAELHNLYTLVVGYLFMSWGLDRRPVPLPDDYASWPSVDVFIPTYNESLEIVRRTVIAALQMDYPANKMAIHILDDGRREEFKTFARSIGAHYICRPDNKHAKAGNLNHALTVTHGDLVAVFDCDHVPTRAFLQMTVGWFLKDTKLALVQTPHHFYSRDPFQRNAAGGDQAPEEGLLFYGLMQAGRDLWNSVLFCGSCALLKRSALNEVGGFAVETVVEDAHTTIRLAAAGYNTAYLRIPLASGLATERLRGHIGQRIRWGRGMMQVIRLDNPLFKRGLRLMQRFSLFSAATYFTFPLPRLIFLLAPLAYLIFGVNIVRSGVYLIAAYAVPHILHSIITNSRLQQQFRHSFWNEVHETTLAFHLLLPTILPLINPRAGKFNVTDKGGLIFDDFFDARTMTPHLVLFGLLVLGMACGVARFVLGFDTDNPGVIVMNMVWGAINLMLIGAVLAVGREKRQIRKHVRMARQLPVVVYLPEGQTVAAVTQDISSGGVSVVVSDTSRFHPGDEIGLVFPDQFKEIYFSSRIAAVERNTIRFELRDLTQEQEGELVRLVFGRADAWLDWDKLEVDRPMGSALSILRISASNLHFPRRHRRRPETEVTAAATEEPVGRRRESAFAPLVALVLGCAVGTALMMRSLPVDAQEVAAPAALSMPAALDATVSDGGNGAAGEAGSGRRHELMRLSDFGLSDPVELRSTKSQTDIPFSIRRDLVVQGAMLHLDYSYSPDLLAESSSLAVTVNDEVIGSLPLTKEGAKGSSIDLLVPPLLITEHNVLRFSFVGHYAHTCEDPLSPSLWAQVSPSSSLDLQTETLSLRNNLAILPRPFFDPDEARGVGVTFVFARKPSNAALQAAGVVASWMGSLAAYRGARFNAVLNGLAPGNNVVFATGSEAQALLGVRQIDGPTLSIMPNPVDPDGKLLLVLGRDGNELATAAAGLVLHHESFKGSTALVAPVELPLRQPYDAPRWIPTSQPVRLGDIMDRHNLELTGLLGGVVRANFRSSPDLFNWGNYTVPLLLHYTHDQSNWLDEKKSYLNVLLNGSFVRSIPLWSSARWLQDMVGNGAALTTSRIDLQPFLFTGRNQILFNFIYAPVSAGSCQIALPTEVHASIDPDSTIDFSGIPHFTQLPNLSFTVNSGFPFTRYADLAETAVVMPENPTASEIEVLMTLFGLFGDSTGYPALRATVVKPDQVSAVSQKDLILIGHGSSYMSEPRFVSALGLALDDRSLRLVEPTAVRHVLNRLIDILWRDPSLRQSDAKIVAHALADHGADVAAMAGAESPFAPHRSLVAIMAPDESRLRLVTEALQSRQLLPLIQENLAVFSGRQVESFRTGGTYTTGRLPAFTWFRWQLADHLIAVIIGLIAVVALLSCLTYRYLTALARTRMVDFESPSRRPQ
ncbi:UDP-forming cellulose synthase catalytic subunit [Telmatospirillum siberiense]|uniref:Cellulose synthase catalytic subunit [UDP-forming] n=1 Tax=Telmatospirillum siberiense TaxID=382514 RepID=A0A2N3PZA0_9PROT|nr:UDP-forming cellulose synthase catalytic subunit [Telmatospirillum siberiense]PKU25744.1 cellulose synthase catalytic subunit (UDP-forming) [Telmatospirillum siberiense]